MPLVQEHLVAVQSLLIGLSIVMPLEQEYMLRVESLLTLLAVIMLLLQSFWDILGLKLVVQ